MSMSQKDKDSDSGGSSGADVLTMIIAVLCMVAAILAAWYTRKWYLCKLELSKLQK